MDLANKTVGSSINNIWNNINNIHTVVFTSGAHGNVHESITEYFSKNTDKIKANHVYIMTIQNGSYYSNAIVRFYNNDGGVIAMYNYGITTNTSIRSATNTNVKNLNGWYFSGGGLGRCEKSAFGTSGYPSGRSVSTNIPVNRSSGGGCGLMMVSMHTSDGDSTFAELHLIRFGYNGNNVTGYKILGSSSGTNVVSFSANSDGYLVVTQSRANITTKYAYIDIESI